MEGKGAITSSSSRDYNNNSDTSTMTPATVRAATSSSVAANKSVNASSDSRSRANIPGNTSASEGIKSVSIKLCCRRTNPTPSATTSKISSSSTARQTESTSNCQLKIYRCHCQPSKTADVEIPQPKPPAQVPRPRHLTQQRIRTCPPTRRIRTTPRVLLRSKVDRGDKNVEPRSAEPRKTSGPVEYPSSPDSFFARSDVSSSSQPSNTDTWLTLSDSMKHYYDTQIRALEGRIGRLLDENDLLHDQLTANDNDYCRHRDETAASMNTLVNEVLSVKQTMMARHKEVVRQWSYVLEGVFKKLALLELENSRVRDELSDLITEFNTVANTIGNRITTLENCLTTELECLETSTEGYKRLSEEYNKLNLAQQQKMKDTIANYKSLLAGKNNELRLLNEQLDIQTKCAAEVNRNDSNLKLAIELENRLDVLQEQLSEVDKRKCKRTRDYQRLICQLETELEEKEKAFHVELLIQRTNLMVDLNAAHQSELERVTLELEKRYKSYLDEYQMKTEELNKADQQKILELQDQMTQLVKRFSHV